MYCIADVSNGVIIIIVGIIVAVAIVFSVAYPKIVYTVSASDFFGNTAVIDYSHVKIHESQTYFYRNYTEVTSSGDYDMLILTPDNIETHIVFDLKNEIEAEFIFYENCTVTNNGSALPYYNRNRYDTNGDLNDVLLYAEPTFTGCDVVLMNSRYGNNRDFGGDERNINEIILNENTNYVLRAINVNTGQANNINFYLEWYILDKNE